MSQSPGSKSVKFHGFTLVELIVVITILVILGTVAFMSLSWLSGSARDGSRASDLADLSKGLDISLIKTSSYPSPDNAFPVTYSGWVLWNQWTMGDAALTAMNAWGARISKKPTDPLNMKEYVYSTLAYGRAYQIKSDWEGDSVAYLPSVPQAYASTGKPTLSYIKGNYNWLVTKTLTGGLVYVLAVPSIVTSQSGAIDALSLSGKILMNGKTNSWGVGFTPGLVYSGTTLPKDDTASGITNLTLAIQAAYSGSVIASETAVRNLLSSTGSKNITSLGSAIITNYLGGSLGSSSAGIVQVYADCTATTYSGYTVTTLVHSQSQTFTKTAATSDTHGTNTYSLPTACTNGILSYGTEGISTACNPTYVEWPGNTCISDICGSTIGDPNAHSTATSQTAAQNWHYAASPGICSWDCNTNYTWNGSSCVADTRSTACGGSIPASATASTAATYTQTWNGSAWTPTTSWTQGAATCGFACNTNYTWNGSSCVANTQTYTCAAKPATGTLWNTVSSYTQTWNGSAWNPANSATSYNTTPSATSCNYACDTGYAWNGSVCASSSYTFNQAISVNTIGYNLRAAAVAAGWNQTAPLNATVTINAGVYVGASAVTWYAFDTGIGFPTGSTLVLINNGFIVGKGGNGGNGGNATYVVSPDTGGPGTVGGPALRAQYAINISNNGTIGGGWGGWGGWGWGEFDGGGGGGAGQGYSISSGGVYGQGYDGGGTEAPGAVNTLTNAGAGGYGGSQDYGLGEYGRGGNGGWLGQSGLSGAAWAYSIGTWGAGGAAGSAVSGNVYISWTVIGTRLGAIN